MAATARLLLHRARAQHTVLTAVVAVAVVGATLLGTFALLLSASQHHLLATALDRTPASAREIDATITRSLTPTQDAVPHATAFVDDLLGDVPATRETWLASTMYAVPGTGDPIDPYVYLASNPEVARSSTLVSGSLPRSGIDADGRVPVAVPQQVADAYGWSVGTEVPVSATASRDDLRLVVTGTFRLTGAPAVWARDELGGTVHDPAYPVLGSAGMLSTQAWGPLVVGDPTVLTDGTADLGSAHLVAHPALGEVPAEALDHLRDQLGDVQQRLAAAVADDGTSSLVLTELPQTIDTAISSLQVTSVTLVVVALLLVTLAVTVLMLAARMLADRRAAEQELMASRGASRAQILRLAALEALAVAVVAALLSPVLAVLAYRAIALVPALSSGGLDVDPGRPAILWITCALASLLLAAVLVAPLLRRADATQTRTRADRRGGAARSGADIALVALALVGLWQLRSYHSPVGSGGGLLGRTDPVLALAPALILLAGAVVALRLMPLVAHVGERLAARSRSWVGPLAVWELGRRPARATAAVLLLTLAVGVGAFSSSFLTTWRTSQQAQADLAVGADVRVTPATPTPLVAAAQVAATDGIDAAAPVTARGATIAVPSTVDGASARGGVPTTLLGVPTDRADQILRGEVEGGWSAQTAPLRPQQAATGVALPGSPRYLVAGLRASITPALSGTLLGSLVLQDATGARTSVALPAVALGGTRQEVVVPLPAATSGLQLVGVVAHATTQDADAVQDGSVVVGLRVTDLRVADGPAPSSDDAATPAPGDLTGVQDVDLSTATWNGTASGADVDAEADELHVSNQPPGGFRTSGRATDLTVVTFPTGKGASPLLALVTPDVLSTLDTEVGRSLVLAVDDTEVRTTIVGTVPYLPGSPHARGIMLDEDLLSRSLVAAGSSGSTVDEWWLSVPDARAASVAAELDRDGRATSQVRATERQVATDGPLHVGVQAALWIVVVAALTLAVSGLGMSAAVTVRARRLEFARLQALGAPRRGLVRSVLVEHAVLGTVGVAVGLGLGALLAHLVAPLITTSASGTAPVPGVVVSWSWAGQLALLAALVALVGLVVALTTDTLLKRASGELLRLGDER